MSRICQLEQQVADLQKQLNNLNTPVNLCKKRIWRYTEPDSLINYEWWDTAAGPHLDPLEWSGAPHVTGFPLPSTAASVASGTFGNTNTNDNNSAGLAARYGIIWYWAWLPDGVTHWRDNNNNTGELGMVLSGDCCGGSLTERPGGNHTANTGNPDRTVMDSNAVTGGWHFVVSPQSDLSVFQGLDLEYSTDNEATWQNVTVFRSTKPEIEGTDIDYGAAIPDGWSCDPIQSCCQPTYSTAGGATDSSAVKDIALQCVIDNQTQQEICNGNFVNVSGRHGWLHTWTPSYTASSGTVIDQWAQVSTAETSPNCQTDITVSVSLGNSYLQLRNMNGRVWYDVRLLVNGAAVNTSTFQNYHYEDDIGTTNLDDDITPLGSAFFARTSVPAGAVITVEIQRRHNFVAGNAAIAAPFGRVISGLRSHFNVYYSPTQIVTGRV